ncbi:MAG: amidase [Sandarakinorhabdus sp.]|nr:amidase [Sandarakinorhabdus sp.]
MRGNDDRVAAGIHQLGVVPLLEACRAGRVSVVATTNHYLERIARFDPALRAFTHVDADGARAAARESARRWDAGTARPLEGVPIAVKANIDVAGLPVHGGIRALHQRIPAQDAEVIVRLKAAGAVILGMLNMHEAALGVTTENAFFGNCQNPHKAGHTPGGSSGGSGAAVAAGLCAAALGTDTLGSIRIPAAYCGISGLKPTNGLVSSQGLIPLVGWLDCIGPLARSVEDVGAIMAQMADLAEWAPIRRIATLSSIDSVEQAPAVRAALALSVDLLEGLGCTITRHQVAIDHREVRVAAFFECAREADVQFGAMAATAPDGFSPYLRSCLELGAGTDAAAADRGRRIMDAAANELQAVLGMAEAVLLPTTPQAAFPHGGEAPVSQADFTALANLAGLPALSIPAGWTAEGLPVGVQLVGRARSETALLALGRKLEAALNAWRPPPGFGAMSR